MRVFISNVTELASSWKIPCVTWNRIAKGDFHWLLILYFTIKKASRRKCLKNQTHFLQVRNICVILFKFFVLLKRIENFLAPLIRLFDMHSLSMMTLLYSSFAYS